MCDTSPIRQRSPHPRGRHTGVEADPELIRRAREEAGLTQAQSAISVSPVRRCTRSKPARSGRRRAASATSPVASACQSSAPSGGWPSAESRAIELRRLCEARSYAEVVARVEALLRIPPAVAMLLRRRALLRRCRPAPPERAHAGDQAPPAGPRHAAEVPDRGWSAGIARLGSGLPPRAGPPGALDVARRRTSIATAACSAASGWRPACWNGWRRY